MLTPLFATEAMSAIFSDRARLQAMLEFEAALAQAEAAVGLIPPAAADTIVRTCLADSFDLVALARETAQAGNPAIPMVKQLTALVAKADAPAARFVHWGATSQDAMDTGLVLQMRAGLTSIEADLQKLSADLATLAKAHATTPMIGRTLLQQAVPVTFGLKAAGWLSAVERGRTRIAEAGGAARVLQFGGAAGTLASLGERGLDVAAELAKILALDLPDLPWHSHRDRLVDLAAALGLLVGTLGKVARDIALLMQTEVGEAAEPAGPGRGGSSTMPHKRNPIGCAVTLAAAMRVPQLVATLLAAMPQEHERGLGGWHAEWETIPEAFLLTSGALRQMADAVAGLTIDIARMSENLEATRGLIVAEAVMMALGDHIGRLDAHHLIEAACRRAVEQGSHLRDVLAQDSAVTAHLSPDELDRLFAPEAYLGVAERFVQRVLAARKPRKLRGDVMDESDRYDLGLRTRKRVLGDAYVDRALARRNAFNSEFQELLTRYAWGEIWTRPGLDERTRRLLVLATTVALGRGEEFKLHLKAAIEHGVSKDEVKEVLLQSAIYCGVPAANSAFHAAEAVFAGLEKEKAGT